MFEDELWKINATRKMPRVTSRDESMSNDLGSMQTNEVAKMIRRHVEFKIRPSWLGFLGVSMSLVDSEATLKEWKKLDTEETAELCCPHRVIESVKQTKQY